MKAHPKGISLPIEMIVIIAIAVLVLVVIVAFFIGGAGTQLGLISDRDAVTRGCTDLITNRNCNLGDVANIVISNYRATCPEGTTGNTLKIACCKVGYPDDRQCATLVCKCQLPPE